MFWAVTPLSGCVGWLPTVRVHFYESDNVVKRENLSYVMKGAIKWESKTNIIIMGGRELIISWATISTHHSSAFLLLVLEDWKRLTSWTPVVVLGAESAVFKPDTIIEERQLTGVVRI